MQITSLVLGIFAIAGFIFGFFPCLGWFNWINIPLSVIGLIISIVASVQTGEESKGMSITGIICCSVAIVFGLLRLMMGGFVL
jgi:hypothetical protein